METFHVSLSVKCCCLKVNVFVSNWVLSQFFRHLCEQQVLNHWQEAILHELVVKGERTKTNVAPRSETTATIRVDTRVRETSRLEFYDNSKVNKSPMLLFWIIRLFWKPLHFFILLFFYQTNSKSLRSAWKRSFDVLIKKYTKLQILFYLNFWSEKKKTATTTLTQIFIQVSEDIHVFALVLYQHIPWRKRTTTIFIGTNTMQIDYFQFI